MIKVVYRIVDQDGATCSSIGIPCEKALYRSLPSVLATVEKLNDPHAWQRKAVRGPFTYVVGRISWKALKR